uniref:Apple domain-containing protein n=1 Tax=Panagrellus redivivus TaxID=6233 RepID=A0A7E4ZXA7_PANRE
MPVTNFCLTSTCVLILLGGIPAMLAEDIEEPPHAQLPVLPKERMLIIDSDTKPEISELPTVNTVGTETTRQCTCEEEAECTAEMKTQAMECATPCWGKFDQVMSDPMKLKGCFDRSHIFMETFIDCFEQNLHGCTNAMTSTQVPKVNLASYFEQIVSKLEHPPRSFTETLTPSVRRIVATSGNFAQCINKCFIAQNVNGFCFDRKGCLPLITDKSSKKSIRKCARRLNWKQQAGEICDCAVGSGLDALKQYCPILKLMSTLKKRRH